MNEQAFRDHVIESLTELKADMRNVVSRLDRINGSVQKHEAALNEQLLWNAKQEPTLTKVGDLEKRSNVDSQAIIKVALIVSATMLAIFKASGPVVDAVVGMLR